MKAPTVVALTQNHVAGRHCARVTFEVDIADLPDLIAYCDLELVQGGGLETALQAAKDVAKQRAAELAAQPAQPAPPAPEAPTEPPSEPPSSPSSPSSPPSDASTSEAPAPTTAADKPLPTGQTLLDAVVEKHGQ